MHSTFNWSFGNCVITANKAQNPNGTKVKNHLQLSNSPRYPPIVGAITDQNCTHSPNCHSNRNLSFGNTAKTSVCESGGSGAPKMPCATLLLQFLQESDIPKN